MPGVGVLLQIGGFLVDATVTIIEAVRRKPRKSTPEPEPEPVHPGFRELEHQRAQERASIEASKRQRR